jgi:putative ABC transport system permease protein
MELLCHRSETVFVRNSHSLERSMLQVLVQDLRYAARMLWKNPGFTAVAVLTLALGIGANTAIFSMVDIVLFRPLPITKPSEVVRLAEGKTKHAATWWPFTSFPAYLAYRDQNTVFSSLAAYVDRFPVNVSAARMSADRVDPGMVTGNYFQTLGVRAEIGRTIRPEDDLTGAAPVVMLSYEYWRNHFRLDGGALGTTLLVDGQPFTVVGVTPRGFGGVAYENLPEVWLPMTYAFQVDPLLRSEIPHKDEKFTPVGVVGRLKPGISLAHAQAQLDVVAAQIGAGSRDPEGTRWTRPWPILVPAADAARRDRTYFSTLVLGIVLLVLLIACADVSGMLLARSEARQKEIAIRRALGAPRFRIISLQVMEGLLVSVLGAILGCLLAGWAARALLASRPVILPIPLERTASILEFRVLAFTALAALIAGIVSSLAPALRYSRSHLALMIQGETRVIRAAARRISLQSLLVVMQITASVILLAGAGLLVRTLWQASRIQLGFDPDHAVGASTDPIRQGYSKSASAALLDPLVDALRAQPGVASAAIGRLPLQGGVGTVVVMEGQRSSSKEQEWVQLTGVTPGYFDTLGIPLLRGRDFTHADNHDGAGLAIINQAIAQAFWPNQEPIGKHIEHVGPHADTLEIIGVAGNVAPADLRGSPVHTVYIPAAQAYLMFPWQPDITLLARTSGDPQSLVPVLRNAIASVDPGLPMFHVRTMREQLATTMARERFLGRLLLVVAVLATVLSAAGVYGLVSYATQRATQELGVRMALGAQRSNVFWLVLRRGLILGLSGVTLGLGSALALRRLLISLLYGVSPSDPVTFAAVGMLMMVVALLACYLPARRATQVDPMVSLRSE